MIDKTLIDITRMYCDCNDIEEDEYSRSVFKFDGEFKAVKDKKVQVLFIHGAIEAIGANIKNGEIQCAITKLFELIENSGIKFQTKQAIIIYHPGKDLPSSSPKIWNNFNSKTTFEPQTLTRHLIC